MTPIRPRRRPPLYRADLPLAWVEKLEQGICTEGMANWAHEALKWRRDAIRATTKIRKRRGPRGGGPRRLGAGRG